MFYSEYGPERANPSDVDKILMHEDPEKIAEFSKEWGFLSLRRNFIHYLLKYRYTENWKRELAECYPLSLEDFLYDARLYGDVIYTKHYTLPHLIYTVHRDFDITLKDKTHAQILMRISN